MILFSGFSLSETPPPIFFSFPLCLIHFCSFAQKKNLFLILPLWAHDIKFFKNSLNKGELYPVKKKKCYKYSFSSRFFNFTCNRNLCFKFKFDGNSMLDYFTFVKVEFKPFCSALLNFNQNLYKRTDLFSLISATSGASCSVCSVNTKQTERQL
jgi:hypothetical protein